LSVLLIGIDKLLNAKYAKTEQFGNKRIKYVPVLLKKGIKMRMEVVYHARSPVSGIPLSSNA
jgi:hypothetical protein